MGAIQSLHYWSPAPTPATPELPHEIVAHVASFLVGIDILRLSHTCSLFYQSLAAPSVWAGRVDSRSVSRTITNPPPVWWCHEKALYLQQRVLLFEPPERQPSLLDRVLRRYTGAHHDCGDYRQLPRAMMADKVDSFSIEIKFSVAATTSFSSAGTTSTKCRGGYLFGFQAAPCTTHQRPLDFQIFVCITSSGGLRIAVANAMVVDAAELECDRWYHLVLTYNGSLLEAYLDGARIFVSRMPVTWMQHGYMHGQIGTGYGYSPDRKRSDWSKDRIGWYPFHGLIDEFNVWPKGVGKEGAAALTLGCSIEPMAALYSLCQDTTPRFERVRRVMSSSPSETSKVHRL